MKIVTTPEMLFFNVIRLVVDGCRGGTAFFVASVSRTSDVGPLFLVTAKHVVANAREVLAYFQAGSSEPELTTPIEFTLPDRWYFHPDPRVDVAILGSEHIEADLKRAGRDAFLFAIATANFLAKWLVAPNPIFELLRVPQSIDELVFVGYPNNYYDPATGLPVMRRGLTATPLWLDYDGEPAFLIDAAVVRGSSGSPVFHVDWQNRDLARRVARLIGIVSESVQPKHVGRFDAANGDENKHIYLGRIYKAHTIIETIEAYTRDSGA
jgi:hypothetical protein